MFVFVLLLICVSTATVGQDRVSDSGAMPWDDQFAACRNEVVRTETEICGARFHRAWHVKNVPHVRKTTVISAPILTVPQFRPALGIDLLPLRDLIVARHSDNPTIFDAEKGVEFAFFFRKEQADWSAFYCGELVIRVSTVAMASHSLYAELLAIDGTAAARWSITLSNREVKEFVEQGFVDLRLPLRCAESSLKLRSLDKLSLQLKSAAAATTTRSEVKMSDVLHSIRIAMPRASSDACPASPEALAAAAFDWFEKYRDPDSGLVPDRAPNRIFVGLGPQRQLCCSIASVGYYLSLLPDAVARGRMDEETARRRVEQVLNFLESHAEHHSGLFYHFIDLKTGERFFECEFSALDTAILLNGCMVVSVRFGGNIAEIADRLIDRVDWTAFCLPATDGKPATLSMGWKPGTGLLAPMDIRSSEFAMPYMLAIGAKHHPIDAQLWDDTRVEKGVVAGIPLLNPGHGLFTSYYGLGWHSQQFCRSIKAMDLWQNAEASARANRAFCQLEESETYSQASGNWWGISAGDSPDGYFAPGLLPGAGRGTVWPAATVAAIPWAESQIKVDLVSWRQSPMWQYVSGPYGLAPFNLERNWVGEDLIGIDIGSMAVNIVNYRHGTIWNLWEQHPVAQRAIGKLGEVGNCRIQNTPFVRPGLIGCRMDIHVRRMTMKHGRIESYCDFAPVR